MYENFISDIIEYLNDNSITTHRQFVFEDIVRFLHTRYSKMRFTTDGLRKNKKVRKAIDEYLENPTRYIQEHSPTKIQYNYIPDVDIERCVVIGDVHVPLHDKKLWKLFLYWLDCIQPVNKIIINGDFWDYYLISKYGKNPAKVLQLGTLRRELAPGKRMIREDLKPRCKEVHFVGGNHDEDRYQRFLWERAPELHDEPSLSYETFMEFDQMGIIYHSRVMHLGKLDIRHGHWARKHAGWSAKACMEETHRNTIINHCHKGGSVQKRADDEDIKVWENFCMQDRNNVDYTPLRNPNWHYGWSFVEVAPSGKFHVYPIEVPKDYEFIWMGKVYSLSNIIG